MKSPGIRSFHLPLPADLYEELRAEARRRGRPATAVARQGIEGGLRRLRRAEARRRGRPATAVARQVIEDGLRALRRHELAEEIAEYVRENAGTSADLDAALEAAGVESLLATEE